MRKFPGSLTKTCLESLQEQLVFVVAWLLRKLKWTGHVLRRDRRTSQEQPYTEHQKAEESEADKITPGVEQ